MRVVEGRAEPASEHGVRDRSQPLGAHDGGAVDPPFARRERGSRAAQDEAVDAPGCVHARATCPRPLRARGRRTRRARSRGASRRSTRSRPRSSRVVAACRRGRAPVAAPVAADEPEVLRERGNLRLPHRVRRPERARQHERRAVRLGRRATWCSLIAVVRAAALCVVAGERAVDERAGRAEVRRRVERRVELAGRQPGVEVGLELLGQETTARRRAQRRVPHELARSGSPRRARRGRARAAPRRRGHRSASRFSRMRCRVDLEPLERLPRAPPRRRRSYASAPESASHSACHAPRRALVLAGRASRVSTEAWPRARRGAGPRPASRRRGSACAASSTTRPPRRLPRTSPTSVCGEEQQVEPDLREHSRRDLRARRRARRRAHGSCARAASARRGRAPGRRASTTSSPRSPSAESVPAAPPSCDREPDRASSASRARASSTATSQPAALSPNVVGTACCSSVLPAIGVSRCVARERRAGVGDARRARRARRPSARRATSIAARVHHVLARRPEVDPAPVSLRRPVRRARGRAARPGCRPPRPSPSSCSQS